MSIVGASRFCRARKVSPPLVDVNAFLPWLEREIDRGEFNVIAPTSDLVCFYIAMVRDKLSPATARVYPSSEDLLGVLFKDRFVPRGTGVIQPPVTIAPKSVEEAHDLADTLTYPCLLKPRSHIGTPAERGVIVNNADELREHYKAAHIAPQLAVVLERFPELALPVMQEMIKARPSDLVTVSGYLDDNGVPLVVVGAKKFAQWPPKLGIGLLFKGADVAPLVDDVVDFVRARLGRGIFELELIPRPDGSWVALDLNPRGYGQMHFDIARGVDLPAMWGATLQGRSPEVVRSYVHDVDPGVRFAHGIPLAARAAARAMRRGHGGWALASFRKDVEGAVGVVHDDDDPFPSFVYVGSMLRHPGGLLRPFLTRPPINPVRRRAVDRAPY